MYLHKKKNVFKKLLKGFFFFEVLKTLTFIGHMIVCVTTLSRGSFLFLNTRKV